MLVIGNREEAVETAETAEVVEISRVDKDSNKSKNEYLRNLTQVPCIWYFITFQKKSVPMSVLFNLDIEVSTIHATFAWKLGLSIRLTDNGVKKINRIMQDT